jgi:hypothetical protein
MALMSPPIAVGDSTEVFYEFRLRERTINVQYRFYTDTEGEVELTPAGAGLRVVTATNTSNAFEGPFSRPVDTQEDLESSINNGTLASAVDARWYEFFLGSGMSNVTISAAPDTTPGGAVTYRVIVDAPGSSRLA